MTYSPLTLFGYLKRDFDDRRDGLRAIKFRQDWPEERLNAELSQINKLDKETFDGLFTEYQRQRWGNIEPTETDALNKDITMIANRNLSKVQKEEQIAKAVVSFIRAHPERAFTEYLMKHRTSLQAASSGLNAEVATTSSVTLS